jgi:YaiO family outer membrane protein
VIFVGAVLGSNALFADDAEDVIRKARELSSNKHRAQAIQLLEDFLEGSEDGDVRLVYGLMLSWDGKYEQARRELKTVLLEHPAYTDAARALANVELWSEHPDAAEKIIDRFLEREPDDRDLSVQRVRALRAMKRRKEALALLNRVLIISPGDKEALDLRSAIRQEEQAWRAVFGENNTWYSGGFSPLTERTLSLKRGANAGSTVFSYSLARQFGYTSSQVNVDSYPHLWKGAYAYVNGGISPDHNLYPHYRFGADIYQNLGHGWEGSGGFRRLLFSTSHLTVYTAMLGRYHANWFFSGRTFLTPGSEGTSRSIQLEARRYLGDGGRFILFRYSFGASPYEIQSLNEVGILNSSSYTTAMNWFMGNWLLSGTAGIAHEERANLARQAQYNLGITLARRF